MKKKLISVFLSVIMVLTVLIVPVNAETTTSLEEDGYPMPAIGLIVEAYENYYTVMRLLTGNEDFSEEHYQIQVDTAFQNIMNNIYEECGIDFSVVWNNLPQTNQAAEAVTTLFSLDIPAVQEALNTRCHELEADGKNLQGGIVRLVSAWLGVVDNCYIACEPVEGEDNLLQIMVYLTLRDGRTDTIHAPVYYNTETQLFSGADGQPVFLGFYFDAGNAAAYTGTNVWQRSFGYCFLYDLVCYCNPFFVTFTTQRIKFNYDDQDWMIQLWKGRYFITNGAEIGVYTRPEYSIGSYYNCADDDDLLPMSLKLTHGDETLFDIPQSDSWWLSEFKLSETAYLASSMVLTSVITMRDEDMLNAFTAALELHPQISYTVSGLDVTISW